MRRLGRLTGAALVAVTVAVAVLAGVWVTGGVLTDDAGVAMTLTAAWFGASGLAALLLGRRVRSLAPALVGAWLVTSAVTGGYLLVTSRVDRVVDEDVVAVPTPSGSSGGAASSGTGSTLEPPMDRPDLEALGRFRSGAHETSGRAALLRTHDGRRLLTLTGFATAPGPDLRVYAVPGRSGVRDAVDLGRLKGNKGDQQYVVPRSARLGSVVIWCRAFSVEFGTAVLRDA